MEGVLRRLLPPKLAGYQRQVHRACLDAAVGAGVVAGCRVEVSSPHPLNLPRGVESVPQRGRGFGGRLLAAWREAKRPDAPLLLVGADVPGLRATHLRQALARLRGDQRRVVLGPSPDGGCYLIAARQPIDHILGQVPWCRRDTLTKLRATLIADGFEVELLEPLADLDRPSDLDRLIDSAARTWSRGWSALLGQLRTLLAALRAPAVPSLLGRPRPALVPVRVSRGPPRLSRR